MENNKDIKILYAELYNLRNAVRFLSTELAHLSANFYRHEGTITGKVFEDDWKAQVDYIRDGVNQLLDHD